MVDLTEDEEVYVSIQCSMDDLTKQLAGARLSKSVQVGTDPQLTEIADTTTTTRDQFKEAITNSEAHSQEVVAVIEATLEVPYTPTN